MKRQRLLPLLCSFPRAKRTSQGEAVITHEVRITFRLRNTSLQKRKQSSGLLSFLCKGYEKDIFGGVLTGFEPHGLSYIFSDNSFKYCCENNITCLFEYQKNKRRSLQVKCNRHPKYAFRSRYINSPHNLSTNDQNRN